MHFLLIMFLALVCMPEVGRDWPRPPWIQTPWMGAIFSWLGVALLTLWSIGPTSRSIGALRKNPHSRGEHLLAFEKSQKRFRIALYGGFSAILSLAGWGWTTGQFWNWNDPGRTPLPAAEIMILSPFLAILVASWVNSYFFERTFYLASLAPWSLGETGETRIVSCNLEQNAFQLPALLKNFWNYLLFKFRSPLALVAIPLFLLMGQKEVSRYFPGFLNQDSQLTNILGGLVVGLIFLTLPWLIRLVLQLKPLPPGEMRDRLMDTAKRAGFRCSNLLVWNTQGGMANAMVVGLFPWPRYVVFTDRMLNDFTIPEIEGVLGHEIGHVKHHHMLFYMVFLIASSIFLGLVVSLVAPEWLETLTNTTGNGDDFLELANHHYLKAAPILLVMLGYVFTVFGFLSRRCERQADIYGCRTASETNEVTPEGIRIFINSLEKVALLNGISREKPGFLASWQHSTIAKRVAFLQGMLNDPAIEQRFQRRTFLFKWGLVLGLCLMSFYLGGLGALNLGVLGL